MMIPQLSTRGFDNSPNVRRGVVGITFAESNTLGHRELEMNFLEKTKNKVLKKNSNLQNHYGMIRYN